MKILFCTTVILFYKVCVFSEIKMTQFHLMDVTLWGLAVYLALHVPLTEMRLNVDEMHTIQTTNKEPAPAQVSTKKPVEEAAAAAAPAPAAELRHGKCYHMPRAACPAEGHCVQTDPVSVFCCNVDNNWWRDHLQDHLTQNTTNLHILNPNIAELNVSAAIFRRLASMALTDGNIGKIVGQFPKHSSIACLNISNNNLTSAKLEPSSQRPFAYLFNLSVLDASANNLTEFPLSLVQSNRKISVDFSGNNYLPCKHFQKAMEANNSSLVTFINYERTFCALGLSFNWFKDIQVVNIDHLKKQKALNESCRNIRPANMNCTCMPERLQLMDGQDTTTTTVVVDCSQRHLKELPINLPANTIKLNVSYNNITSLQAVADDPTYESLTQLIIDYNDITNIVELEGSKFIDNFVLFTISHNKLKTIHTYVLSNKFDTMSQFTTILVAGNYIHCDCNTEKVLKPWLLENFKNIPDYKSLQCQNNMGPVVDLIEYQVCHSARDWTDYIYYIIGLEVLVLVLLFTKVSYDYWVFKTAGYLPWPANKMPRLPCDWLCE